MNILKEVEKDIGTVDKYVEYCTRKYKPFFFDMNQFIDDVFMEQIIFIEDQLITNG
jgi:hypothetical protein